ncbi:hypothetical protein CDAR_271851 [Caerostris darwini]|uniref:Uncharacterized protein n=1 Tax=Caerostris darwini TaxID=1538125 RepID=A0AAV4S3H4_9ARAC|nr:hypothetical protein CDAR_271851 [Caerostris darwini]
MDVCVPEHREAGFHSVCVFRRGDDDVYDVVSNFPIGYAHQVVAGAAAAATSPTRGTRCCSSSSARHPPRDVWLTVTDAGLWASLHRASCTSPSRTASTWQTSPWPPSDPSFLVLARTAQLLPSLQELNLQAYHVTDSPWPSSAPSRAAPSACSACAPAGSSPTTACSTWCTCCPTSPCSPVRLLQDHGRRRGAGGREPPAAQGPRPLLVPAHHGRRPESIACDLNVLEELALDRWVSPF